MKLKLLFFLFLFVTATVDRLEYPEDYHVVKLWAYRYKGLVKGLSLGFYDGVYKGESLNKQCLDDPMVESIYLICASFKRNTKTLAERAMRFSSAFASLYNGVRSSCHAPPLMYDTVTYCFISW